MRDTKTKSTAAANQLLTLAQNVELCAKLKGLTLEAVAKKAKVPLSLLEAFKSRAGVLTPDTLEKLAFELGVTKLELLRTGPLDTRTAIFTKLLDAERLIEVPHEDFDRSFVRGGKSFQWPVGVKKGDVDDEEAESEEESEASPPAPETEETEDTQAAPEAEELESYGSATESIDAEPAQLPPEVSAIDDTVTWMTNTRAICNGQSFDLTDKRMRGLLGRRLHSARGSIILREFGERMRPKRSTSWLHNLKRGAIAITRSDLEQAVTICKVPLSCVLTGHGLEEAIWKNRR